MRISLLLLSLVFVCSSALRAGILEDRVIEDTIEKSYVFRHVLTDRSMVQISVRYGKIELRGQVADERERELIADTLRGITNVTSIENNLFVDSPSKRDSSRWRAQRVRADIATHSAFDATRTQIAFNQGAWEIAGQVPDESQRALLTAHVRELTLAAPVRVSLELTERPGPTLTVDDASVVAMVQQALSHIPAAPQQPRLVVSRNGVVQLQGMSLSRSERDRISHLASNVRGVKSVENRMTVGS